MVLLELTPGELQEILRVFVESDLQELQLQVGDVTLQVSKNESNGPPVIAVQPQAPSTGSSTPAAPAVPTTLSPPNAETQPGAGPDEEAAVDRPGCTPCVLPLSGFFTVVQGPTSLPTSRWATS